MLFGHHFAAISGAGPLIGPVLAAQFGYLPGLLWIVIGVCLGGAVQDFLVLAASIRRGGKIAGADRVQRHRQGRRATAATVAILFIIIIALAGWGKWSSRRSAAKQVQYPAGSRLVLSTVPAGELRAQPELAHLLRFPPAQSSSGTTGQWHDVHDSFRAEAVRAN